MPKKVDNRAIFELVMRFEGRLLDINQLGFRYIVKGVGKARLRDSVFSPSGGEMFIVMDSRNPKLHGSDMEMTMPPRWGFRRWGRWL